jgi:phytoene desaturase
LFSILSFLEYEHGVFHPVGGCGAVTQAMALIAEAMGVRILLDAPVEELLFDRRRVTGVRTAVETLAADAVVVNADFAQAMQRMIPDRLRRRWTDARIAKKQFSCSTFMMYLGIEGCYDEVKHLTIYFSKEYEQNLRDIERDHRLTTEDPSCYVQNACVTDATLAPEGMSPLYVLTPVTHECAPLDWAWEEAVFARLRCGSWRRLGLRMWSGGFAWSEG